MLSRARFAAAECAHDHIGTVHILLRLILVCLVSDVVFEDPAYLMRSFEPCRRRLSATVRVRSAQQQRLLS